MLLSVMVTLPSRPLAEEAPTVILPAPRCAWLALVTAATSAHGGSAHRVDTRTAAGGQWKTFGRPRGHGRGAAAWGADPVGGGDGIGSALPLGAFAATLGVVGPDPLG